MPKEVENHSVFFEKWKRITSVFRSVFVGLGFPKHEEKKPDLPLTATEIAVNVEGLGEPMILIEEMRPFFQQENLDEGGLIDWKRKDTSLTGTVIKGIGDDGEDYEISDYAADGSFHIKRSGADGALIAVNDSFAVAHDLRGKGVGRQLWQRIEEKAREHGAVRFELHSVEGKSQDFWTKMGFKPAVGGSENRVWVKEL